MAYKMPKGLLLKVGGFSCGHHSKVAVEKVDEVKTEQGERTGTANIPDVEFDSSDAIFLYMPCSATDRMRVSRLFLLNEEITNKKLYPSHRQDIAIWENGASPGVNGASPGVNGDQETTGANKSGAVYVFTLGENGWSQQAYVKASNPGLEDQFGQALALSGDTLAVGSSREKSGSNDQEDNTVPGAGAVYIFTRSSGVWSQQAYLKASNIGRLDYFGASVDLDGDTLVVGAYEEDGSATGVNGVVNDSTLNAGAAYVFTRTGETWSQQAYLKASNTGEGDKFGNPVAISGDTIVVGAFWEDSSATGVDGDQLNVLAQQSGAAYTYKADMYFKDSFE